MKEIGGYLELEHFHREPYHKEALELNTARGCLLYLIRARGIKKLYLPHYLCDSVANACDGECECVYYPVNREFMPMFGERLKPDESIYIVNYYGFLNDETIIQLKEYYGNIIIDNVQAFFRKPLQGIDTLYSCRKFFGVPDGAYLYSDAKLSTELEYDYSSGRLEHLVGRLEYTASEYYSVFKENENRLNGGHVKIMSKLTSNLLRGIDYKKVRLKRNENFYYLSQELGNLNGLGPVNLEGPFVYPLYCKKGPEVRSILADKHIYIPTYWPNVLLESKYPDESDFAANILPLPCDQRYCVKDMKFITDNIKQLLCLK